MRKEHYDNLADAGSLKNRILLQETEYERLIDTRFVERTGTIGYAGASALANSEDWFGFNPFKDSLSLFERDFVEYGASADEATFASTSLPSLKNALATLDVGLGERSLGYISFKALDSLTDLKKVEKTGPAIYDNDSRGVLSSMAAVAMSPRADRDPVSLGKAIDSGVSAAVASDVIAGVANASGTRIPANDAHINKEIEEGSRPFKEWVNKMEQIRIEVNQQALANGVSISELLGTPEDQRYSDMMADFDAVQFHVDTIVSLYKSNIAEVNGVQTFVHNTAYRIDDLVERQSEEISLSIDSSKDHDGRAKTERFVSNTEEFVNESAQEALAAFDALQEAQEAAQKSNEPIIEIELQKLADSLNPLENEDIFNPPLAQPDDNKLEMIESTLPNETPTAEVSVEMAGLVDADTDATSEDLLSQDEIFLQANDALLNSVSAQNENAESASMMVSDLSSSSISSMNRDEDSGVGSLEV